MARGSDHGRRPPPRRVAPERRRLSSSSRAKNEDTARTVRTVLLVVFAVLGVVLVWKVLTGIGNPGEPGTANGDGSATGASGGPGVVEASPPPQGRVSSTFPRPVLGTRLALKVLALGDDPQDCRAESLRLGGDIRTVYHHECGGKTPGSDTYFLLVRLTNLAGAPVPAELDRFSVTKPNGDAEPALQTPTDTTSTVAFFPPSPLLGPDASIKGWITFDGSDGFTPAGLTYRDGAESLLVRFRGDWTT